MAPTRCVPALILTSPLLRPSKLPRPFANRWDGWLPYTEHSAKERSAMEEGPEPHEFIKESVEHHQHEQEHAHAPDHARRETVLSACTAAVLAVCAAIGSLLSGHAANEAILHQTRASDQWNFYQAKSTKGHIYQVGKEIIAALSDTRGKDEKLPAAVARFEQQVQKYDQEK